MVDNVRELKRQIGQMLVVGFDGKTMPKHMKEMIHEYHIGGIILFSRNIGTPSEVLQLTTALQKEAKQAGYQQPLFICIDQENGIVRRLGEGTTAFPGAMALGATQQVENAYHVGVATGKELKALGINWNLSPVVDVNNNPRNPVIGVRSFGESPDKVAMFGEAAMKGMQAAGVITTLKHFPGYGDMGVDPHLALPVISHNKKRLDEVELFPFNKNIQAGVDTVMSAHVYFPSIDDEAGLPATLSKKVITDLLREELGFDGVVTTDCMEMNAISHGIGTDKGAVRAIQAGIDLIMISHTYETQIQAIEKMLLEAEQDESVMHAVEIANKRIQRLKAAYLQWEDLHLLDTPPAVADFVGGEAHEKLAASVFRESVTIVNNEGLLPLSCSSTSKILLITPGDEAMTIVEDKKHIDFSLSGAIKVYQKNCHVMPFPSNASDESITSIAHKAKDYDYVIIGTNGLTTESKLVSLVQYIQEIGIPIIVIAMKSPYDIALLPKVSASICTYEPTTTAIQIAVGALFGKEQANGALPVSLS
ncbi:beta-N-acetylhexosaminidase [Virgibacillus sp. SK37]|uniref:beta-N-acetylhexosaminidase n=1 Tax=Virgibacillus sp. SK37 TaxID=403957 RepID=UPI0004D0E176|nr:beta-N-acetylhexosaminidase [Virgibacillus sp. SK37]AIF44421.1 beta-glucosidase [Virgibacillus sp. SK37]